MPTLQWREGSHIYWHGSSASRMLEAVEQAQACVTVTIIDGFVMARSAFHHSANYRSVMVLGTARKITDNDEKEVRLKIFVDTLFPGRWDILRPMKSKELKATTVMSLPLSEASAKVRTGGPRDDEEDYALPIWAGVVPLHMQVGAPIADTLNLPGLVPPAHVTSVRVG
jgi:nitroimidazol reductase NimA-like FMN-containing flavoprotein (pyridoxamine 5'-phosphate oxidase superfamily)